MYWESVPIGSFFKDWAKCESYYVYKKVSDRKFREYEYKNKTLGSEITNYPLEFGDFEDSYKRKHRKRIDLELITVSIITLRETNYDRLLPS